MRRKEKIMNRYRKSHTHFVRTGENLYQLSNHYGVTVQSIMAQNPAINPFELQVGSSLYVTPSEEYYQRVQVQNMQHLPVSSSLLQNALSSDLRRVYSQNIFFTRALYTSITYKLKDQELTAERIVRSCIDISEIFARYYSPETADKIACIHKDDLQLGSQYMINLRDKNIEESKDIKARWLAVMEELAEHLSYINPHYKRDILQAILQDAVEGSIALGAARLVGNFAYEIAFTDKTEQRILELADYFAMGIAKQFPHKFV